ncbi:MAG: DNA adenine methylase [Candidatus Phytoplasma australasiaticum]|nr:DNA adenine methylase [Candidatus Phytoplasma australasiaticum]
MLELLKKHVEKLKSRKKEFYYNFCRQNPALLDDVQKTVLFIFLNKTCFNGLYHVNFENKFNTPFNGKYKITLSNIINENNLNKIIIFLKDHKNKIFFHNDYKKIIAQAQKNDFIFLPPLMILTPKLLIVIALKYLIKIIKKNYAKI